MSDPEIDNMITQRTLESQAESIRKFLAHASPGNLRRLAEQDVRYIERVLYVLQNKMPYEK